VLSEQNEEIISNEEDKRIASSESHAEMQAEPLNLDG